MLERLVPLATLVTPNRFEAEILAGRPIVTIEDMAAAGEALLETGALAVLVKGGHFEGLEISDVLVARDGSRVFRHERLRTTSTHGTGCTLAAAVTAGLARGMSLPDAVARGLDFVHRAIVSAPELGSGRGPLDHFVKSEDWTSGETPIR